jgi:2-phospho-L-lactate guanylyltransferase
VVPDLPRAGLNPALEHGAELLRAETPGLGVATVSADLPSLRPADLQDLLRRTQARAFVADAAGTGTTVLAAAPGHPLGARYGLGSRAGHAASGALELDGDPRLRRDVDTPVDLKEALALGVGPRTAQVARELGVLA